MREERTFRTDKTEYRCLYENGVRTFLGVPYASAERWKRARVLQQPREFTDATRSGKAPWQDRDGWNALIPSGMSEDCLNLNLYAADTEQGGKTVMVWIYGGAQVSGSNIGFRNMQGTEITFDGASWVREHPDTIVVVPNYRVGIWGSVCLSFFTDYEEEYRFSNNLARTDIITCLQWIRENISDFGGDAGKITMFGQSAGSSNITALMLMPEADGLFHRAICESSFSADISMTSAHDAEKISRYYFKLLGCETLSEALDKSNEELLRCQIEMGRNSAGGSSAFDDVESKLFSPVVDEVCIKGNYWELLMNGMSGTAEILAGTNSGEYDPQFMEYREKKDLKAAERFVISQNWGKLDPEKGLSPKTLDEYRQCRDSWDFTALMDLKNDLYLRMGALEYAAAVGYRSPAYLYFMDLPSEEDGRCCHGREIPILFGQDTSTDPELQKMIRQIWYSFAVTGSPGIDDWKPCSDSGCICILREQPEIKKALRPAETDLLLPLMKECMKYPDFQIRCRHLFGDSSHGR